MSVFESNTYNINLRTWMKDLPLEIKQQKINQLHLLGSHDSAAYKFLGIEMNTYLTPRLSLSFLERLRQRYNCVNRFVSDWTITQAGNIYGQLHNGIRCFDLRLCYNQANDLILLAHSFVCISLIDFLNQVKTFLTENQDEVIVILMKEDWVNRETMTQKEWDRTGRLFNTYLGDLIMDSSNQVPSLLQCQESNKRVLIRSETVPQPLSDKIWKQMVLRFFMYGLLDSPTSAIIRKDAFKRVFFRLFGYQPLSLKNFSKTPEEWLETYLEDSNINDNNIWWLDFASESLRKQLIQYNYSKFSQNQSNL